MSATRQNIPDTVTALQARARAAQPDWLQALDDHGLSLAEWRWPGGLHRPWRAATRASSG